MKNEDMPANALSVESSAVKLLESMNDNDLKKSIDLITGETKREKAFWQVYSAMIASDKVTSVKLSDIAEAAIAVVDEGFKALEQGE